MRIAVVTENSIAFKRVIEANNDSWVVETFNNFDDYRKSLEIGRAYDKTLLVLQAFKDRSRITQDFAMLNNLFGQVIVFVSGSKENQMQLARYLVTSVNASKIGCLVVQGKLCESHIIEALTNEARDINIKSGLIEDEKEFINSFIEVPVAEPKEEKVTEEPVKEQTVQVQPPKKKGGFFSKLFGTHSIPTEPQTQGTVNTTVNTDEQPTEQLTEQEGIINEDTTQSDTYQAEFSEGNMFEDNSQQEQEDDWDNAEPVENFSNFFTDNNNIYDEDDVIYTSSQSEPAQRTEPLQSEPEKNIEPAQSEPVNRTEPLQSEPVQPVQNEPVQRTEPLQTEPEKNVEPVQPVQNEPVQPVQSEPVQDDSVYVYDPENATQDIDNISSFDTVYGEIDSNVDENGADRNSSYMDALANMLTQSQVQDNTNTDNKGIPDGFTENVSDDFTEITDDNASGGIVEDISEDFTEATEENTPEEVAEEDISNDFIEITEENLPEDVTEDNISINTAVSDVTNTVTSQVSTYAGETGSVTQAKISENITPVIENEVEFKQVEISTPDIELNNLNVTVEEYVEPAVPDIQADVNIPTFRVSEPQVAETITEGTVINTGVKAVNVAVPDMTEFTDNTDFSIQLDDFDFDMDIPDEKEQVAQKSEQEESIVQEVEENNNNITAQESVQKPVQEQQPAQEPKKKKGFFKLGRKSRTTEVQKPVEPQAEPITEENNKETSADFSGFEDIDITEIEQDYTEAEQQSRVQIKEVRVNSQLENVIKGRGHRVIYVVGNGNTTNVAYNLAKYMSKHCRVLYVDADTKYHGILSKIDYFKVVDYEQIKLTGFSLSLNDVAFHNNVIKSFEPNLDILIDDYFTKYRKEDTIEKALGVILDNALVDYNFAVIDLPFYNLGKAECVVGTGLPVFVANATRKGYSDFTADFVNIELKQRYLKMILGSGVVVPVHDSSEDKVDLLKLHKNLDIFNLDEHEDWTTMKVMEVNPTAEQIINTLFES